MNKLENLHTDAIKKSKDWVSTYFGNEWLVIAAQKSVEITTDVAISFSEWMDTSEFVQDFWRKNRMKFEPKMDCSHNILIKNARKELFDYFINNVYGN